MPSENAEKQRTACVGLSSSSKWYGEIGPMPTQIFSDIGYHSMLVTRDDPWAPEADILVMFGNTSRFVDCRKERS